MSEAERFLERLQGDAEMTRALVEASESAGDGPERLTALLTVARERGFATTAEELAATISRRIAAADDDLELSDEELEQVSGGMATHPWAICVGSGFTWGGCREFSDMIPFDKLPPTRKK